MERPVNFDTLAQFVTRPLVEVKQFGNKILQCVSEGLDIALGMTPYIPHQALAPEAETRGKVSGE